MGKCRSGPRRELKSNVESSIEPIVRFGVVTHLEDEVEAFAGRGEQWDGGVQLAH